MPLTVLLVLGLTLAGCADAAQQADEDPGGVPSDVQQGPDLAGSRWRSAEVTGFELPGADAIALEFSTDGQVRASIACNSLGGTIAVEDGRLVTDGLFSTEMGCDADAHAADQWLADLLESRPAISQEGTTLTITGEQSSVVLIPAGDGSASGQSVPQEPASDPATPDQSVAHSEVEVIADEPTMPEEEQMAPVGLVTTAEDLQTQWDRFGLTTPAPSFDFTEHVLLFVGFGESGSCPLAFGGLEVTGQTVRLTDTRAPVQACTADFNPRTLVLAVPRELLPDGFVTVESSGPAAVISVEPAAEPPPASATRYGATVADVALMAAPTSAVAGTDVTLQLRNDGSDLELTRAGPHVMVERWTGHHFEGAGLVGGVEPSVEINPAEGATFLTLSTAGPAFADAGWFRLTTQLAVITDGLADGSMEARANLQLTR